MEFYYNSARSASTGNSPHSIVYGVEPRLPVDAAMGSKAPAADDFMEKMKKLQEHTQEALQHTAECMKKQADRSRTSRSFNKEDYVMLSTDNLNLKNKPSKKLKPRWVGPFRILQKVGNSAYKLDLPSSMTIHPVINIDQLKEYKGRRKAPPEPVLVDDDVEYEVEQILRHRKTRRGTF